MGCLAVVSPGLLRNWFDQLRLNDDYARIQGAGGAQEGFRRRGSNPSGTLFLYPGLLHCAVLELRIRTGPLI